MSFWWACVLFLAMGVGLAGCDSPSMAFKDIPTKKISVAGSDFSIRHTAYEAEAIRINTEWGARRRDIVVKAAVGIEAVSGCNVLPKSVRGDTNIVVADLACKNADPALRPEKTSHLECEAYEIGGISGDGVYEVSCAIVRNR